MRPYLQQRGAQSLTSAPISNFLIFRGEFFSDLGGNEMSASSAPMIAVV